MRQGNAHRLWAIAAAMGCVVGLAACGAEKSSGPPVVVASTSVIGSIVESIVGDAGRVKVAIPNGKDPHEFSPSARDVESIDRADLVVVNGGELESGLVDVVERLDDAKVFTISNHVTMRGNDPHVWLDPNTMLAAVPALTTELGKVLGRDLSADGARLIDDLKALDADISSKIESLKSCELVTDHDALEYFAARYGCTIVGSVVPGLSSAGESTASDVQSLKNAVAKTGVRAIFVEPGSSGAISRAVADELGINAVELTVERLPERGGYVGLMRTLADTIVKELAPA